jgi:cytoskeletal protein RodZ
MSPELSPMLHSTGALMVPGGEQGANTTVKLTGPVKVVQVPVAGQPGRYLTGLLPVESPLTNESGELSNEKKGSKRSWKTIALSVVMLLAIIGASSVFWFIRTHQQNQTQTLKTPQSIATATPNVAATATGQVQATATAKAAANLLFMDPLAQNSSNWPVGPNESFLNGAYTIKNSQNSAVAVVLPGQNFTTDAYNLTMWEIKGNDTSNNNSFGMIFRFNQQTKNGKAHTTFYSFEIVNMKGGYYRFYKYDDSQGSPAQYWTKLWEAPIGSEYHLGQGSSFTNTVRIYQNGSTFSFTVNGKLIKTAQDNSFKSGTLGMLVNLNGTEVAFKNLLVTRS